MGAEIYTTSIDIWSAGCIFAGVYISIDIYICIDTLGFRLWHVLLYPLMIFMSIALYILALYADYLISAKSGDSKVLGKTIIILLLLLTFAVSRQLIKISVNFDCTYNITFNTNVVKVMFPKCFYFVHV